jgi:hypothetical protein
MLGCAPDGIVAPPGLLTRPAQTKHSTCQRATGERTTIMALAHRNAQAIAAAAPSTARTTVA